MSASSGNNQHATSSSVAGQPADRFQHLDLAQCFAPQRAARVEGVAAAQCAEVEWLDADLTHERCDELLGRAIITSEWHRESGRPVGRSTIEQIGECLRRYARERT